MAPDRIIAPLTTTPRRPAIVGARLASILLLILTLSVPVVGVISVQALRTANTAACRGANQAKEAVTALIHTLVTNAERPIANATPDQLARQEASILGYKRLESVTATALADTPGC